MRRGMTLITLISAALAGVRPAPAQQPTPSSQPGPYARMVVIAPKSGQEAAFEAGYQRHLDWHRKQRDPWSWMGWSFVLGERLGLFTDGTFGHAAADFDQSVNPAGDGADNEANVTPYADFLSHGVYERLSQVSRGAPLPDTSALLALTTYHVAPGREAEFETALAVWHRRQPERPHRYTWMRLRLGGKAPQYVLFRSAPNWAVAVALPSFFQVEPGRSAPALPAGLVESVRSELLRFRPTLSYLP